MMSGSAADRPQEKTFDLTIERGAMAPDEIIVDEGDKVNLQIISDRPLEFHLHGYDLEKRWSQTSRNSFCSTRRLLAASRSRTSRRVRS